MIVIAMTTVMHGCRIEIIFIVIQTGTENS
jgi:hypothetical protein